MQLPQAEAFRASRNAVSAVFFANGFIVGCWAILVPVIINNLAINESTMGLIILTGGLSAILALVASSRLIQLFGARAVMVTAALILAPALLMLVKSTSIGFAMSVFVLFMTALACQDVAMNANAAELEQSARRAIMSAFHGFWSAGAMTGALVGGTLIAAFGVYAFALGAGALALGLVMLGARHLEPKSPALLTSEKLPGYLPRQILPWLFGSIAFVGFVSEGAVIDWSAQYFREELSSGVQLSGFAFGGFSLSMMLSRFVGDRLREKLGDKQLFVLSVVLASCGMTLAALASNPVLAAGGFFFAGFGNANLVPIAFSAAASIKGLPKGMGIATATLCGYSGLLVAPALLGLLGERLGFAFVFFTMAILLLMLLVLAPMVGRQHIQRTAGSKAE